MFWYFACLGIFRLFLMLTVPVQ